MGAAPPFRGMEPQKGAERSDEGLGVDAGQVTHFAEKNSTHQGGVIAGGIVTLRWEHSLDQPLVPINCRLRQASMKSQPGAKPQ